MWVISTIVLALFVVLLLTDKYGRQMSSKRGGSVRTNGSGMFTKGGEVIFPSKSPSASAHRPLPAPDNRSVKSSAASNVSRSRKNKS